MVDLAIDRAIAAVKFQIDDWEEIELDGEEASPVVSGQIMDLRAALAILAAAKVWQEKHDGPGGTVEEVMPAERDLLRATRSDS